MDIEQGLEQVRSSWGVGSVGEKEEECKKMTRVFSFPSSTTSVVGVVFMKKGKRDLIIFDEIKTQQVVLGPFQSSWVFVGSFGFVGLLGLPPPSKGTVAQS